MQCGAACLSMICRHYGKVVSPSELEDVCHTTNQGVSFKGIGDAATTFGLNVISIKISVSELVEVPLPAILHWNQNHFVVLYHIDKDGSRFWIADPGKGKYKVSKRELESNWVTSSQNGLEQGVAMLLHPTAGFDTDIEKHEGRRSFGFLLEYFLQYKHHFLQIILGLLVGCVLQLAMPQLTQWIVDLGISHQDIKLIWLILLGELMIVVGRTVTDFIRRWLLLHISMRVNISMLSDFFIKLLKLPMSFFETKLTGDLEAIS